MIFEFETVSEVMQTQLAFKLLPRNSVVAVRAFGLHFVIQPLFEAFKMNPLD